IEQGKYNAQVFLKEMETLVTTVVKEVKNRQSVNRFSEADIKVRKKIDTPNCPKCKTGKILKGKTAFGCSEYKKGCHFVVHFEQYHKKLSENQIFQLINKKKTNWMKDFKMKESLLEGRLIINKEFKIEFQVKEEEILKCPRCKEGTILKGKKAFGCNRFKSGCKTTIPFEIFGKKLTNTQIKNLILKGQSSLIKGLLINGEKKNTKLKFNTNFEVCPAD
ncbi:MAG: hypothetical protein CND86_03535, partial [Bacteroidetes bacterium MED-G21]